MPNYASLATNPTLQARRQLEKVLDHGQFAQTLEFALTSRFTYGEDAPDLQAKCVPSARMSPISADSLVDSGSGKGKKYTAFIVYVAYRLEPGQLFSHQAKLSRNISRQLAHPKVSVETLGGGEIIGQNGLFSRFFKKTYFCRGFFNVKSAVLFFSFITKYLPVKMKSAVKFQLQN